MVIIIVSFSQCSQTQTTFYHHHHRHLQTCTVRFVLRPVLTLPTDWPKGQISAVMYGQTDKRTAGQSQAYFQNSTEWQPQNDGAFTSPSLRTSNSPPGNRDVD